MLILHELLQTFFLSLICCHNGAGKSVFHAQIEKKSLFIESTRIPYITIPEFFSQKSSFRRIAFPFYSRLVFLSLAAVTLLSEFCCITLTCYLCYCYSSDWTRQADGMIHGLSHFFLLFCVFHFSRLCKTKWCFCNCHLEVLFHCLAFYEMC